MVVVILTMGHFSENRGMFDYADGSEKDMERTSIRHYGE